MFRSIASLLLAGMTFFACSTSSSQPQPEAPPPVVETPSAPAPEATPPAPETNPAPTGDAQNAANGCMKSGCSGILCVPVGQDAVSTCEYKNEYACYKQAKCEKQPNGQCGWTKSPEFDKCLAAGGPAQ